MFHAVWSPLPRPPPLFTLRFCGSGVILWRWTFGGPHCGEAPSARSPAAVAPMASIESRRVRPGSDMECVSWTNNGKSRGTLLFLTNGEHSVIFDKIGVGGEAGVNIVREIDEVILYSNIRNCGTVGERKWLSTTAF